jgi:DNA-binding NarL/FixJ family response regulator
MTAALMVDKEDKWEYEPLTPKEIEVMCLFSNPYFEYAYISDKLSITVGTLKSHINHIFDKLEETDRYSASIKFFQDLPHASPNIRRTFEET